MTKALHKLAEMVQKVEDLLVALAEKDFRENSCINMITCYGQGRH